MLSTSLEFLVFLPFVAVAFYVVPPRVAGSLLLISSLAFYAIGAWEHVSHILLLPWLGITAHIAARKIAADEATSRRWFVLGLVAVLSPLLVFKYWNFAASAGGAVISFLGLPLQNLPLLHLAIPAGISFVTLQALSYVIDVYLGRAQPARTLAGAVSFVSFFPLALAGPIERAGSLMPQLDRQSSLRCEGLVAGGRLLLWGFFKKLVVADNLAALVAVVYDGGGTPNGLAVLVATYAFALQIYCDFSGYSDIARGAAKVLGIDVMQNFESPYEARSIPDFWRRWHISLSTWLRDYVFTPLSLGGPRTRWWGYGSIVATFLLSGLWHGAGWTFVAWGLLHGVYIVCGSATRGWRDRRWGDRVNSKPREWLARVITFHLVCVSWVLFRSPTLGHAFEFFTRLADLPGDFMALLSGQAVLAAFGSLSRLELVALVAGGAAVLLAERVARVRGLANVFLRAPGYRLVLYALLLYSIIFLGNFGETSFIYSQF